MTNKSTSRVHVFVLIKMTLFQQYIKAFYNETFIEKYDWDPDEEYLTILYSLTVSIFAIGGMTGALLVGKLVTKFGRLVVCILSILFQNMSLIYLLTNISFVSKQERDTGEVHCTGVFRWSFNGF